MLLLGRRVLLEGARQMNLPVAYRHVEQSAAHCKYDDHDSIQRQSGISYSIRMLPLYFQM